MILIELSVKALDKAFEEENIEMGYGKLKPKHGRVNEEAGRKCHAAEFNVQMYLIQHRPLGTILGGTSARDALPVQRNQVRGVRKAYRNYPRPYVVSFKPNSGRSASS